MSLYLGEKLISGATYIAQETIDKKANDSEVVHLTGNETITGRKIVNTGVPLYCGFVYKGTSLLTATEGVVNRPILMTTSDNKTLGTIQWQQNTGFNVGSLLCASQEGTLTSLQVGYKSDGTAYTYAPACSATNSILTTTGISKAANGYVKLGNGIIIQWGSLTTSTNTSYTITLPVAFSNTSYKVFLSQIHTGSNFYANYNVYSIDSSSSFKIIGQSETTQWLTIGY